jgi:S-adenosylmethionine-dependent methyltransferase
VRQSLGSWGLIQTGLTIFPDWFYDAERITAMLRPRTFENEVKGSTLWYWSTPPDALAEIEASGIAVRTHAGAESFLGGMTDVLARTRSAAPARYGNVISLAVSSFSDSEMPQIMLWP